MSQVASGNFPIPNDTGANFRADVNENLSDLYSTSSGSSAPPAAIDNQLWIDTSTTPDTLKCKQGSSWISLGTISTDLGHAPAASPTFSGNLNLPAGSSSSLPLRVTGDTDTGLFFATNTVNIHAGGTTAHEFTSSASTPKVQVQATNASASSPSYSFASDTNTGLFRPGADRIGVSVGGAHDFEFSSSELEVRNGNSLRLNDNDNSNHLKITAPSNLTSNYTLTLPGNDGSSGEFLKTDGSGVTSWATPTQTALIVKGAIAFDGTNSTVFKSEKLTMSRTSTGNYTITLDSSIRTGNSNYGIVIGNIDEMRTTGNTHAVNDNWTNAWPQDRGTNSFTILAIRFQPFHQGFGGDDEDRGFSYSRQFTDPNYISVVVF